jgi:peptide/nickel transport system permease protein
LIGWTPNVMYLPFSVDPIGNITFFIIPALLLGTHATGSLMRMTRSMMLEVLRSDYIRTARAKGLNEQTVIVKHAMKNSLIPVVTILGNQVANVVGGSTIVENVFAVPGMGRLLFTAIQGKDAQVVQACIVMFALFTLVMNLLFDISYAWLDPRVS